MEHKIEVADLTKVIEMYRDTLAKTTEEAMLYKALADKYYKEVESLKAKIEELEKVDR